MLKQVYLILTGENELKRPRSKKLLRLIENHIFQENEFKIIISGKSAFRLNVDESECERLRTFLIQYGVNASSIILEEESMDTLANMIFSVQKITELISKSNLSSKDSLNITLITEKFHMNRSKKLFLEIFKFLQITHNDISFDFKSANSFGFSRFFLKRKLILFWSKLISEKENEDLSDLKLMMKNHSNQFIVETLVLYAINLDVKKFKISTYQDYIEYLYSLPVYRKRFNPSKEILDKYSSSIYRKLIRLKTKES